MENKSASDWIDDGEKFYEEKNYNVAAICYETATRLAPNHDYAFHRCGLSYHQLADIKRDSSLFEKAFEYYNKAIQLAPKDAAILYNWGNALFSLAKIKNDVFLFERASEKYDRAIELDPNRASAFDNCGIVLSEIANIKQDQTLFERAFEFFDKAIRLKLLNTDKASVFNNWGIALSYMAEIKQDQSLFECAFEKFKEATTLNQNHATAFNNWGLALYHLAEIKQCASLFERAFKKFYESTQLDPNDALVFSNWGRALCNLAGIQKKESLFEDAFKKFRKAEELDPNNATVFNDWGIALSMLAEIKQDETLFKRALEKYDYFINLCPNNPLGFYNWGLAVYRLAEIKHEEELYKISVEYFILSKRDILGIFATIYRNNKKQTFHAEYFYPLLDSSDAVDALFFNKITKNVEDHILLNKYKDIYLRAIFIINLLHINNPSEKLIAQYREKDVSQILLFDNNSKFRLNAIDHSNDPHEGKTLLTFLYDPEKRPSEESLNTEYEAFASCFTFDHNNLNQFRLYGKDCDKEGTGLSLVFRDNFFSKEAKTAFESPKVDFLNMGVESQKINRHKIDVDTPIEKDKLALFRCIYIDPNPDTKQPIVTVGQKEEYLFYREGIGDKFKEYDEEMKGIVAKVRDEMNKLKELANELYPTIAGQLLLNLRYLVKHVAFKEEQECRIVKIHSLFEKDGKIKNDFKRIYIEYPSSVPMHLDKIYFGPKATGIELFQSMLKNKNLNIPCEQSTNPLA
jgi:Tfp pilus assembly protein PilF